MTLFLFQKKVLFSARKTIGNDGILVYGQLIYDAIDVNVGDGLQANGKFVAPQAGIYGFTFSAATIGESMVTVNVYKDGILHHKILEGFSTGYSKENNMNSSWMMKLAKGQVVHLEVTAGNLFVLSEGSEIPVIFTGNLLMLDE